MVDREMNDNVTRRRFLQSTAAVGTGLGFAPVALAQVKEKASDDLQIGLIGAGSQGQLLLSTCMKIPGIRCKAVCDIWESYNRKRATRILTGFGQDHALYADFREMLETETSLDAVIVATPDFCHAEQAIASLNAGLHVYCESPISNTLAGARDMVRAARKTGKLLQIGQQRRSNPRYRYCHENILNETGLLGRISAASGQWNRPVQPNRGWPRRAPLDDATLSKYGFGSMERFRNWRWYKELGGGPLAALGTHQLDVFSWFLDAHPKSVMASGGIDYYDRKDHECYDTIVAVLEYERKGKPIRVAYQSVNANSNLGYFEGILGDEGTLNISEAGGRANVYREPAAPEWSRWAKIGILTAPKAKEAGETAGEGDVVVQATVEPPTYGLPVRFNDPVHAPHLDNFFQAVRGTGELHCPGEVGYAATVTVMKINEAIAGARKLDFRRGEFDVPA